MNKPISEARAWEIAREFATEATSQDINRYILGIFMIGSLAAKQYRPGWSDIDTVIVTRDSISDEFRARLKEMRASYQLKYGIPKGFGGIVLREQDLKPPYDPEKELVPEIYRLLQQGKPLWGEYDLSGIPTPSRDDFRAYAKVFYTWLRSLDRPDRERTIVATVNRILIEIRLFIWDRTDAFILNKRELIPIFLETEHGEHYRDTLRDVHEYVIGNIQLHDLDLLERLLEDITNLVAKEVNLSA